MQYAVKIEKNDHSNLARKNVLNAIAASAVSPSVPVNRNRLSEHASSSSKNSRAWSSSAIHGSPACPLPSTYASTSERRVPSSLPWLHNGVCPMTRSASAGGKKWQNRFGPKMLTPRRRNHDPNVREWLKTGCEPVGMLKQVFPLYELPIER